MAYLREFTALLCLIVFSLPAQAQLKTLSPDVLSRNFAVTVPLADLAAIPGVSAPAPAYRAGDYTGIPAYNFAYLNDLNVKLIDAAASSVDVVIFSITLKDNPDALLRAAGRGVKVRVILDEAHAYSKPDPQVTRLMQAPGIELRTLRGTRAYGVNHNKILLCDRAALATGSYNWTFGATFSNHENTLVTRQPAHVTGYVNYFEWMWAKARTLSQGAAPELPEGYYGSPPQDPAPALALNGVPVPAYLFSPGSRSEERLAGLIDAARTSVDAVTFTFSSKILADALVRARLRGAAVRFLTDKNMGRTAYLAKQVFDSGVPMRWGIGRNGKGAMHDKFLILDGRVLQTGSFNWTVNASKNSFENMLFVSSPEAVSAYQAVFNRLYEGAETPAAGDFQIEPYSE